MKGSRGWWGAYWACVSAVVAAMIWVSGSLLSMERELAENNHEAQFQSSLGLALWRMESWMLPVLSRESSRAHYEYLPYYPAHRSDSTMFNHLQAGDVLNPSPLLTFRPEYVHLHFQIDESGRLSSPQSPADRFSNVAVMSCVSEIEQDENRDALQRVRELIDVEQVRAQVRQVETQEATILAEGSRGPDGLPRRPSPVVMHEAGGGKGAKNGNWADQVWTADDLNRKERSRRQSAASYARGGSNIDVGQTRIDPAGVLWPFANDSIEVQNADLGPLVPLWLGEDRSELFFVRRVSVGRKEFLQGAHFDWRKLRETLLAEVSDLLPEADLIPRPQPIPPIPPAAQGEDLSIDFTNSGYGSLPGMDADDWSGSVQQMEFQLDSAQSELPWPEGRVPAQTLETRAPPAQRSARLIEPQSEEPIEPQREQPIQLQTMEESPDAQEAQGVQEAQGLAVPGDANEQSPPGASGRRWQRGESAAEGGPEAAASERPASPSIGSERTIPSPTRSFNLDLASFPATLRAERPEAPEFAGFTPGEGTVAMTWAAVLIALLTAGITLRNSIEFGSRRHRFASAVTHELRTPLTTFSMYSEMLADGMVTDEAQRQVYYRTLKDESSRLAVLVENVLSYSRVEDGRARAHREEIALSDLIARIRSALERRCQDAGLALVVSQPKDEIPGLQVDVEAVGQVLFNLIDNACKYGCVEGAPQRVRLEVDRVDSRLELAVRDEGPGIPSDDARKIFRAFERARHDGDKAPGIGLGLALAHGLALQMGGQLELDTRARPGARFVLSLPLGGR